MKLNFAMFLSDYEKYLNRLKSVSSHFRFLASEAGQLLGLKEKLTLNAYASKLEDIYLTAYKYYEKIKEAPEPLRTSRKRS